MSVACVASARASIVGVSRIECLVAPPAARPAVTDRARPFIEVLGASLDGGLQLVFPRLLCVFVLCVSVTIALIMRGPLAAPFASGSGGRGGEANFASAGVVKREKEAPFSIIFFFFFFPLIFFFFSEMWQRRGCVSQFASHCVSSRDGGRDGD